MNFASDNAGPAAPEIIEAIKKANDGYEYSYGADTLMDSVREKIRTVFEAPEAAVYLVATGTAANSLALACLCPPWATIYCHGNSHVEEDECGAPEFYSGGAKLTLLGGPHAKIQVKSLETAIESTARAGVHNVQKGVLSLTNATENGTVYTCEEVTSLAKMAHDNGIPCHMDGARFANAVASLGCTPAELSWKVGIDILSLGGTKNGLLGVEAVILFDPSKSWEFELRRKRGGHLLSKHRYLSAQMVAYLENGLWLRLAARANSAARRLASGIGSSPNASLIHPQDANMVFAKWPRARHRLVQFSGASYYLWPFNQSLEGDGRQELSARLVCNWATTDDEVDKFVAIVSETTQTDGADSMHDQVAGMF